MKTFFTFDDHSIPFRSNVDLTLLQGVKYSLNPILMRGKPGSPDARWARLWGGTVLYDKGMFRMWYSGAGSVEEWMMCRFNMLYAESKDGFEWVKPNLGLKLYKGSKNNNLCDVELPIEMPAIFKDDSDDVPQPERYKMFSENHCSMDITPLLAVSPDGLKWNVISHPKHRGVSLYKFNGLYHSAFVMYSPELPGGFNGGRVMGTIRSRDWKNWDGEPCLSFYRANYFEYPPNVVEQVHTPAGFWNRDNVILGVYGQIHQVDAKPGTQFARLGSGMEDTREDLGFFISNDGLHFREPMPSFKILARGEEGMWDGGSIVPSHSFVNVGEHTFLYYGAWQNGMCFDNAAGDIGLAFWRRDGLGFIRIRVPQKPAVIQTEAINTIGKDLEVFVNFEMDAYKPGCGIDFEVVDQAGNVLPGYSAKDCITNENPGLCQQVRWKKNSCISKNIKKPVELRATLKTNGDLTPYLKQCSSPLLYCIYVADKGEMNENILSSKP